MRPESRDQKVEMGQIFSAATFVQLRSGSYKKEHSEGKQCVTFLNLCNNFLVTSSSNHLRLELLAVPGVLTPPWLPTSIFPGELRSMSVRPPALQRRPLNFPPNTSWFRSRSPYPKTSREIPVSTPAYLPPDRVRPLPLVQSSNIPQALKPTDVSGGVIPPSFTIFYEALLCV
ncbi:YLP motif-containing protein 1-like [Poecilia reticulata]|uniref:YLP motif-containing protein 1-like n=1 Tax=Poecilia reticulata TaxID=8081 RepID=UPI0004A237E0|nr:PREDICTED: YLP motif-containing protein 1-like [Poecilia reticulata]